MTPSLDELKTISREIRIDILTMLHTAGSGHTGGSLSAVEMMVALFFAHMHLEPGNPCFADRDRFVLSKGHAAPVYYAVLARLGFITKKETLTLRRLGSCLQGHPDCKLTPGIEVSSGSLGQGLSIANGMALGFKIDRRPVRVFALLGDGEVQEGQIWEAAMTASHYRLDNLCALLDNNGLQIDGPVAEVKNIEPLSQKWESFGWHVRVVDGHDLSDILEALDEAAHHKGQPSIIIGRTIKGKGVSIFENKVRYHGLAPTVEELAQALKELSAHREG